MDTSPPCIILQDKIRSLCIESMEKAEHWADLSPEMVGLVMRKLSVQMARRGNLEEYHRYLIGSQMATKRLMEELEEEFGEALHDPLFCVQTKLHDSVQ